jgi:hypothetical protein
MKLPGFTAEISLPNIAPNLLHHARNTKTSHLHGENSVMPAWWGIGACGLGLCLIHCFEDEGAKQSRCLVYELPF